MIIKLCEHKNEWTNDVFGFLKEIEHFIGRTSIFEIFCGLGEYICGWGPGWSTPEFSYNEI